MEFKINDSAWIHLGEKNLVEGKIVHIFDLEGDYTPNARRIYVLEIDTSIDPIYEARTIDSLSPDKDGPVNLFRKHDHSAANRLTRQLGMPLPQGVMDFEHSEPSVDEINAALDRSHDANRHSPISQEKKPSAKKRFYKKKVNKAV